MSHEDDYCFQCQESGHIAHHCPNVQCFKCDEYCYIVMDCPHMILPSGTPACHHRPISHSSCHTRPTSHHSHKEMYRRSWSRSQSHPHRYHSKSHHDSYRGHSRSHHKITDDITGVVHDAHTQPLTHIILTRTLHIADHLHIEALQLTPGIAANYTHNQYISP